MIDSFLWQPGVYYVVVAPQNGAHDPSRPYRLELLIEGSVLTVPPPSPEVEVRLNLPTYYPGPDAVTTLYIYYPDRMLNLYGRDGTTHVPAISSALNQLSGAIGSPPQPSPDLPPEWGVVLDVGQLVPTISSTLTISQVYQTWFNNQGNPLYANYVAGLIDNLIESATRPDAGPSGDNPAFVLGNANSNPISFPNVRNIVLIGGDEVLPFFRLPDLTEIANESDYLTYISQVANGTMLSRSQPLGAALYYRMLLSDNPYGSGRPYRFAGSPLFLPRLAVGRIVERPSEIARYLDSYASGVNTDLQIDATPYGDIGGPTRTFVSGYDFLKDQAAAVTNIFTRTGLVYDPTRSVSNDMRVLNNDLWTRIDAEREWFDGRLDTEFVTPVFGNQYDPQIGLSSVNAHFDHWQLLPATATAGNFPARRLLEPTYHLESSLNYFRSTLGFSVGCHSGYNVVDSAILTSSNAQLYQADFAQAFNRNGGNWIGNTGFGYGTADGIDYSERLAVLLTEELARGSEVDLPQLTSPRPQLITHIYASIGESLMRAKQRYVRNATSLSAYDYKSLSIMTLYGLPFIRVTVSNPLPPLNEDPRPDGGAPLQTVAPISANNQGRLSRTITFTLNLSNSVVTLPRTGSQVIKLDPEDFTVEDEFAALDSTFSQTVRLFANDQLGAPSLPTFAYDISALSNSDSITRLRVRDVVFVEGDYGRLFDFNPQITQVATETDTPIMSTTLEPNFSAGAGFWYPYKIFSYSSVGEGELQRDQLTSFAAQFKANEDGLTGQLRGYRRMVFRVFYEDPPSTPPALATDTQGPMIESVEVQTPQGFGSTLSQTRAEVIVRASDSGPTADGGGTNQGIGEVSLNYIVGDTTWVEQRLTLGSTEGVYSTIVPVPAGEVRFIVRATDVAGNSSYFTAKGRFTPQPELQAILNYLPLVVR